MRARTIHPFPARMAPEIALDAIPNAGERSLSVLDPMCGSGTVLSAAMARGQRSRGIDIDPLAVMMARAAVTPVDAAALVEAGVDAASTARSLVDAASPWGEDTATTEFAKFWFGQKQRQGLKSLVAAINRQESEAVRLALRVALSRIIVTKQPQASLAADTSHSRPHRVLESSSYDVYAGFERSVRQLAKRLEDRVLLGSSEVDLGDSRTLNAVEENSVDLVVTSPPYLNALDYLRGHKLALIWFGYTIAELRDRRGASIGSERNASFVTERAREVLDEVMPERSDMDIKLGMIERFAEDCCGFAEQIGRVTRSGGRAVLVVGNSTLRGNYIRNDAIVRVAMQQVGFELESRYEREIPPSSRYMAISAGSSLEKRMRKEVVLTLVAA